jgi:hypothetical protein
MQSTDRDGPGGDRQWRRQLLVGHLELTNGK